MQAVVLAGGLGTRLRPVTGQTPKVMVPVNGRPFLLILLELLRVQGIVDIVLCTGYRGEQIRAFFGDGKAMGLSIRYSEEKEGLLGTGGALKQAQDLLDEHFFVFNGDTYLLMDYTDVARAFLEMDRKGLMVVYDNHEASGIRNNVRLGAKSLVIRYSKETNNCDCVEAGVLILRRDALDYLEAGVPSSLEKGLYPALIKQRELAAYLTRQRFYDIGTPRQLKVFEEYLQRGNQ